MGIDNCGATRSSAARMSERNVFGRSTALSAPNVPSLAQTIDKSTKILQFKRKFVVDYFALACYNAKII